MTNFNLKIYEVGKDRVKFEDLSVSISEETAMNYLNNMYDTGDKTKTKHYGEALELLGINDSILETLLHDNPKFTFNFLDEFKFEEKKLESPAIHIDTLNL